MARWCWLVALLMCVAGCGGHHRASQRLHPTPPPRLQAGPPPRLEGSHPCPHVSGFTCASLQVPLDYAGEASGTLHLLVGLQRPAPARNGVLVFLTGGPGQPGVSFVQHVAVRLGSALAGYRLVMFDQRGTGAGALRCPALQAAAGSSDLVVAPRGAVAACASAIGSVRRYFTTPEAVADLDRLRVALGASRITLDGVSYGTYLAERYALTYPRHVARLVLDSVVPQGGVDATYLSAIQATARVLRSVCAQTHCAWDPARDVAAIVRRRHDGPELLDALVGESVAVPSFAGVLAILHAAAAGRDVDLDRFLSAVRAAESAPAQRLSQGLHQSTLCLDLAPPWNPGSSPTRRAVVLRDQVRSLPAAAVFPLGRATVLGNGLAQGCLPWPATAPPNVADGDPSARLPSVPVLLLSGERDLSTPLSWAREEAAQAPDARLVIVPKAGHSLQTRAGNAAVRRTLAHFLSG